MTIAEAISAYLENLALFRSEATVRAYRNGLEAFGAALEAKKYPPAETPLENLPEEGVKWLAIWLKRTDRSAATERLYLAAAVGFYKYLVAEELAELNLPRVQLLLAQNSRQPGRRLPQFPREAIEQLLTYALQLKDHPTEDMQEHLRNLRDRAFLLTLADTGLRVHEACGLRRGDVDWAEGRAVIIGKGDKEAVIRFSMRALQALREYLEVRQPVDTTAGRPLPTLPLFAGHGPRNQGKLKTMTTKAGRDVVRQHVAECLGKEAEGTITPHSFRHYFVTTVLRATGGNIHAAQKLARHSNINTTERYAHLSDDELDQTYHEVFNPD